MIPSTIFCLCLYVCADLALCALWTPFQAKTRSQRVQRVSYVAWLSLLLLLLLMLLWWWCVLSCLFGVRQFTTPVCVLTCCFMCGWFPRDGWVGCACQGSIAADFSKSRPFSSVVVCTCWVDFDCLLWICCCLGPSTPAPSAVESLGFMNALSHAQVPKAGKRKRLPSNPIPLKVCVCVFV